MQRCQSRCIGPDLIDTTIETLNAGLILRYSIRISIDRLFRTPDISRILRYISRISFDRRFCSIEKTIQTLNGILISVDRRLHIRDLTDTQRLSGKLTDICHIMPIGIVGAVFAVRTENGGLSTVFIVFSLDRECTVIPL